MVTVEEIVVAAGTAAGEDRETQTSEVLETSEVFFYARSTSDFVRFFPTQQILNHQTITPEDIYKLVTFVT